MPPELVSDWIIVATETAVTALVSGLVAWLVAWWSFRKAREQRAEDLAHAEAQRNEDLARADRTRVHDVRLDLVREIWRHRGSPSDLIAPLNEVPLLFAGDEKAAKFVQALMTKTRKDERDQALSRLVNHLGNEVGLPGKVDETAVSQAFRYARDPNRSRAVVL